MFSGQGAQYVGMACHLYLTEPTFRKHADVCLDLLASEHELDLRPVLFPTDPNKELPRSRLEDTAIAQPALFVIEYALARLWMDWGINPRAVVGHSVGEIAAAAISGILSPEECLALATYRGRLMQSLPRGSMLAVQLPHEDIRPLLRQEIEIAAINTPSSCVVSGPQAAIAALRLNLSARDIVVQEVRTSHAYHSHMMDPILDQFTHYVDRLRPRTPSLPYLSGMTGSWLTDEEAVDPRYWVQHVRQPVRFADALRTLTRTDNFTLLEIGPGQTLSSFARRSGDLGIGRLVLSSLPHAREGSSDLRFF